MYSAVMENVDYDLVLDQEFDALNLEVKAEERDVDALKKKYPARSHARRVASELRKGGAEGTEKGIIFLPGEPTRNYDESDQGPKFRQRRYFYYITGVNYPDCSVTYEIGRDKLTLWIPYVEPRQALYFGSVPDAAEAMRLYDADEVRYVKDLPKFLKVKLDQAASTVFLLNKKQLPRASLMSMSDLSSAMSTIDATSLKPAMDRARVIKDAYEIALMRRANAISSHAHREIARNLLHMRNEQDVEAVFVATCTTRGAHSQAYAPIAASGANGATLHYDANNQILKGKDLMVVDMGCEVDCYASDITRTLPVSGSFTKKSKQIYDIVEKMQEACIEAIKPGVKYFELHLLAAKIAMDGLLELGVLKGDREEVAKSRIVSAFFPHGLGHHMGLEVHDVSGDDRLLVAGEGQRMEGGKREIVTPVELEELSTRNDTSVQGGYHHSGYQALEPGMIITVEPGIYFNPEYIKGYFLAQPKFAKFIDMDVLEGYFSVGGVRIEDGILVTRDGYENLTTAPKGEELLDVINGTYDVV